nr:MAG TPA: hypothetical protein [Inoviridae sp.]
MFQTCSNSRISAQVKCPHNRAVFFLSHQDTVPSVPAIYPQKLYISLPQKESISSQTSISIYIHHKLHKKQSGASL